MANPWSSSVDDVAMKPMRRFLDNDHRITSVALAEEKLNKDPNDIVTKLRMADQQIARYGAQKETNSSNNFVPETVAVHDLATNITTHLSVIYDQLEQFDEDDTLRIALLNAIRSCSAHKEELSVVNRAKLIECLKNTMELIPKIYKKAGLAADAANLEAIGSALDVLQSNGVISQEDLYNYIRRCTVLLESLHQ